MGGGGRVLLCTQRDQLDCPPPNGLNHYLPLNKTGAHSTGEGFRATMALLLELCHETSLVNAAYDVLCSRKATLSFVF